VLIASSDLNVQQEVLAKFIDFEPLKSNIILYILHAKGTKVQTKIIQNIKTSLNVVKCAKTKYHLVDKHATLSMECLDMVKMLQLFPKFLRCVIIMWLMQCKGAMHLKMVGDQMFGLLSAKKLGQTL
jgi:hypothetical protein